MSAADEAYEEWRQLTKEHLTNPRCWEAEQIAFVEGYRRALEDAADEVVDAADSESGWWYEAWLRARAVAVDPHERKG